MLLLVALVGCASPTADSGAPPDFLGRLLVLTASDGRQPALQTALAFQQRHVDVYLGCHGEPLDYRIDGDHLVAWRTHDTPVACLDEGAQADLAWVHGWLEGTPTVDWDAPTLTVATPDVAVAFTDVAATEQPWPLAGPTWTLQGVVGEEGVQGVTGSSPPRWRFVGTTWTVETACHEGAGSWREVGESLALERTAWVPRACTDPGDLASDALIAEVFATGTVDWRIERSRLRLSRDPTELAALAE